MEYLDGVVYDDVDATASLTEDQGRAASYELVDVLARLHAVDYEAVGLGGFGRPAGYLARQVARWQTQWEKSKTVEMPVVDEVARRLERRLPEESRHAIVHGDYSFNNTMYRRDDPTRIQAVLDWEMSTLGDPLTDVGMVAVYWTEVGEIMWRNRKPQAHRANAGFPDVDSLLDRYAVTSGTDLAQIDFYRAFATYKLAVIAQGGARRVEHTDPERAARVTGTVAQLAELALGLTEEY
jgi:aminoglycoside phosphotransferase (APT) family kinase protein